MNTLTTLAAAAVTAASLPMAASAEMGMRGMQHIGLTVPDLDAATSFFVDVMGCEAFFSFGPFGPFEDDWMTKNLNVNPRAVIDLITMVKCSNGPAMELFKYTSPDQKTTPPKNSDIGGFHIAFYVDDINAATQHLRDNGITVLEDPHPLTGTGLEGMEWVYFLSPWGTQMEIVSAPNGIVDEQQNNRAFWSPKDS